MVSIFLNGKTLDELRFIYQAKDYGFKEEEIKPNNEAWLYFYKKNNGDYDESDGLILITDCEGYYGSIAVSKYDGKIAWRALEHRLEVKSSKSAKIVIESLKAKFEKKPEEEKPKKDVLEEK